MASYEQMIDELLAINKRRKELESFLESDPDNQENEAMRIQTNKLTEEVNKANDEYETILANERKIYLENLDSQVANYLLNEKRKCEAIERTIKDKERKLALLQDEIISLKESKDICFKDYETKLQNKRRELEQSSKNTVEKKINVIEAHRKYIRLLNLRDEKELKWLNHKSNLMKKNKVREKRIELDNLIQRREYLYSLLQPQK